MFGVSFTLVATNETVFTERNSLEDARQSALRQAEAGDRKDIVIWQAVERVVPALTPVNPNEVEPNNSPRPGDGGAG